MKVAIPIPLEAATGALGGALPKRSRLLAALIAATVGLGLAGQLSGTATAADSTGLAENLRVGHTVKDIVVPGSALGEQRRVKVHLWYPADQPGLSVARKAVYTSALHRDQLSLAERERWDTIVGSRWDPLSWQVDAEVARENAVIDPNGPVFPVIVFSHGSTNDPIDYAHTLELMAGAGFVVAAPYHVNNTQDDVRIDFINTEASRVQPGLRLFDCRDGRPSPCSRPNVPFSMADRVRDISHTLDELPRWFGDRVDVSRAGVLGHSRGTVTALAAAGGSAARSSNLNCQPAPADLCWPLAPEPRVKAIMGMAIGARPITFAANMMRVKIPTLLVAGTLDRNPGPAVSKEAFDAIPSGDKALVSIENATHRSFDSTYCAQMQAAGAAADKNGDGKVEPSELDAWTARAILDWHTVRLITSSFPGGLSGKAVHYCAAHFFTNLVDIQPLVASIPGSEVAYDPDLEPPLSVLPSIECPGTTRIPPCTGLETEEVKQGMKELAVTFFGTVLKRVGNDGVHFTRYLAPKWLEKHESMVDTVEAIASTDAICPPGQGCED